MQVNEMISLLYFASKNENEKPGDDPGYPIIKSN